MYPVSAGGAKPGQPARRLRQLSRCRRLSYSPPFFSPSVGGQRRGYDNPRGGYGQQQYWGQPGNRGVSISLLRCPQLPCVGLGRDCLFCVGKSQRIALTFLVLTIHVNLHKPSREPAVKSFVRAGKRKHCGFRGIEEGSCFCPSPLLGIEKR